MAGTSLPDDVFVVSAHFDHLGVIGGTDLSRRRRQCLRHRRASRHRGIRQGTSAGCTRSSSPRSTRKSSGCAVLARSWITCRFPRERLRLDINVDEIGRADDGRLFAAGVEHTPALRLDRRGRRAHLGGSCSPRTRPFAMADRPDRGLDRCVGPRFVPRRGGAVPLLRRGGPRRRSRTERTLADRIAPDFYAASAETVLSALIAADRDRPAAGISFAVAALLAPMAVQSCTDPPRHSRRCCKFIRTMAQLA